MCLSPKTTTSETTDGQTGGDKHSNKKTGTKETTDSQTGGDKHYNEKTGTRETTDGQTGGDKHSNKKTGTTFFFQSAFECLSPLVRPLVASIVPVF
jgi:hypothetical protein